MLTRAILHVTALTVLLAPALALAQTATEPPAPTPPAAAAAPRQLITILAEPGADTRLRLKSNATEVHGLAPLDLPATFEGHFSVTVQSPTIARTRGTIDLPSRGVARLLSEPRGPSVDLLVRSLNVPGLPNLTTGRTQRGAVLTVAFVGGAFAATRAHLQYRDRLGEFGAFAADRAQDEKAARNDWARFTAVTWAVSAVDYWLRPRLAMDEAASARVVVSAPTITRGAIAWRSLLVPGAGQEFANHSMRGAFWLGAALAAGAGVAIADGMVERDQTRADWAKALVDSAGPSERGARLQEWSRRTRDLQSSEDLRRGFRYAVFGAYALNLVDALTLPIGKPEREGTPRLSATVYPGGTQLQASLHF